MAAAAAAAASQPQQRQSYWTWHASGTYDKWATSHINVQRVCTYWGWGYEVERVWCGPEGRTYSEVAEYGPTSSHIPEKVQVCKDYSIGVKWVLKPSRQTYDDQEMGEAALQPPIPGLAGAAGEVANTIAVAAEIAAMREASSNLEPYGPPRNPRGGRPSPY